MAASFAVRQSKTIQGAILARDLRFVVEVWRAKTDRIRRVKYWEIIADHLSKAGWSLGCVSAIDFNGRTIWILDPHRDNGKRLVVHAEEKLTALWNPNRRFARDSRLSLLPLITGCPI
jgi:hypothetical protein